MMIAEATHQFSAAEGYRTELILEKYYSDGTFSNVQKFNDDIVVTPLDGLQEAIQKNIGQHNKPAYG